MTFLKLSVGYFITDIHSIVRSAKGGQVFSIIKLCFSPMIRLRSAQASCIKSVPYISVQETFRTDLLKKVTLASFAFPSKITLCCTTCPPQ